MQVVGDGTFHAFINGVEQVITAGEPADARHGGSHAFERHLGQFTGKRRVQWPGNLQIPKALVGESGRPALNAVAGCHEVVGLDLVADVQVGRGSDQAGARQGLAIRHGDRHAGRRFDGHLGPARDLLTEVINPDAGQRLRDGHWLHNTQTLDGRMRLRGQPPTRRLHPPRRQPILGFVIRRGPARQAPAGVVSFPDIDVVVAGRPLVHPPLLIRDHHLAPTIGVLQV